MADIELAIGQRVEANGEGRSGTVAFTGMTKFASGVWIGVILDAPDGKNDGSVNGHSYFTCEAKHGVFVRATQVKILEDDSEPAAGEALEEPTDTTADAPAEESEKEDVKAKYANKVKQKKLALAERRKEISKKEEEAQQRAEKKAPRDEPEEPAAEPTTAVKSRRSSLEKERPADAPAGAVPKLELEKISVLEKSLSDSKASQENAIAKMKEAIKERDAARRSAATADQEMEACTAKLKEIEGSQGSSENEKQELSDMVESLTMDVEMERDEKEILEEKTAELELRVAELEGDIELYLESKDQTSEGGDEMKLLTDQNTKLKEALQRLHEATLAQQNRIKELERDNKTIEGLQSQVMELSKKVKKVDKLTEEVETLKEALEEASEFGEFAEELTEKNLKLSEQLAEMTEQVDFYEEMKEAAEMMEEAQQEEIRELQVELSSREALETNSVVAIQQMKSKVEEAEEANEQLRNALKMSQDQLTEMSSNSGNSNPVQLVSEVSEQQVLSRKFEQQKQAEEAAANKLELALALVSSQVLQAGQDCYAAMVNSEEDLRSIDAVTQLTAVISKGQVIEAHLREQAASLAVAGDLDELQRTVAVHKVIVDAVGIAETMLDAMSHKEEVFLKLGQRNRDLKLTTSTLDALINSIKHGQALEVDSAQELLQKLSSLQSSEALSEHECSHSILMSATCKLNSEARLLSVVGAQIASLGSSDVVTKTSSVIVGHAQILLQAADRILQKVKGDTQKFHLDDVQKSSLVGTVDTVAQQVVRVTKALQEARDDEPKLNEFMIEVGMDMETAQVSQDSKPDCIDALLDAAVGKLRVFGGQIADGSSGNTADDKQPSWVRRGTAHCEALTFSTQFTEKYAAAEEELKGLKTAVKRGEKDLEDANAKVQVLSKRLEAKTTEITSFKSKVEELSKQEETYQKAMDVLQDSLQEQVNKKNAAQEKLGTLEAEMVTRALTAPHPGAGIASEGSISFGSADASTLQLTVQSLWKMNRSLRSKLMSKHVSEFPAPSKAKAVSTKQTQLSDSVNALQRDVTSLMAMPKVVSILKSKKADGVQPEQRWRQANAEIYKAQYRCNELKGQLQREYLKINPGAAAQTNFGLFPSRHVASEVFQPGDYTQVGRVVLSDKDANGAMPQKVHLSFNQFHTLHSAIVAN